MTILAGVIATFGALYVFMRIQEKRADRDSLKEYSRWLRRTSGVE